MRDGAHREQHLLEEPPADGMLRKFGRDVQPPDQSFLIFEDVEGISRCRPVFERYAAGKGVCVKEPLVEFEGAAVVPMQFVAPMPRFFLGQRLNLTNRGLSQFDDVRGAPEGETAPTACLL